MRSLQRNYFKINFFHKALAFADWLAALPNKVTPPSFRVIQMGAAFWQSRVLYVAAKLGIADCIADTERSCAELAEELSLHEDSLYRLLRMLASLGVFNEVSPRCFSNSKLSDCLRSEHPKSVLDMVMLHNSPEMTMPWIESLEHAVRTGDTPFVHRHGDELFSYLDHHPEFDDLFARSMATVEALTGNEYLHDFDWSRFDRLIDVGGSQGGKALSIIQHNDHLKAVVFDRPQVIAGADKHWRVAGKRSLLERMTFIGGDMSVAIPASVSARDIYLFIAIFHGMSDAQAITVLKNLRRELLKTGARAAIVDAVAAEPGIDPTIASFDMQMLIGTKGRERTLQEWHTLLHEAGLAIDEIVDVRTFAKFIVISPLSDVLEK